MPGHLSDYDLLQRPHLVQPFSPERVQPASYDLTLATEALVPITKSRFDLVNGPGTIDLRKDNPKDYVQPVSIGEGYELPPGGCLLASTVEVLRCPMDTLARIEGKSTLGRLFLAIHVTAGFVDPGWEGQITLEIVNHGPWIVVLWEGMKIAQASFYRLNRSVINPYGPTIGSHYQGQRGPTAAASWKK